MYYDMVTDFYEYGWGQSFHFAPRFKGESFEASIARYEYYLALRAQLCPGMRVIDIGCGVGGPARNIARHSGARVTGLNNNEYQIERARIHTGRQGLSDLVDYVRGNFMDTGIPDNTFDAAYAIEATCHASDKRVAYSEIRRIIKPGAYFTAYEWCMTDKYDPSNPEHRAIKLTIEARTGAVGRAPWPGGCVAHAAPAQEGDGLPDIESIPAVLEALRASGFEIVDYHDHVRSRNGGGTQCAAQPRGSQQRGACRPSARCRGTTRWRRASR